MQVKRLIILAVIILLTEVGCSTWKPRVVVNGVDIARLKKADPAKVIIGGLSALVVHEGMHALALEITGAKDYKFEEPWLIWYNADGLSHSDEQWIARAGMLGQSVFGTILTAIPATRNSDYTLGYTAVSAAQTVLYPLPPGDSTDLKNLDHPWEEYTIYSLWSLYNLNEAVGKEAD